jgi:AAA+ ATPase superfamily predicted ATPase
MSLHEVLLPGHLYLMIFREKLEDILSYLRAKMIKDSYTNSYMKIREMDYIVKNL